MKHLNDKTIQSYVDGELTESKRQETASHLEKCPSCKQKAEARRAFADKLKESLDTLVTEDLAAPKFEFGHTASPKVNVARIAIISSVSTAAAITLIVMVFNLLSKPKPTDYIFDYYTIEDYDANRPFAEQELAEFKMRTQSENTDTNL